MEERECKRIEPINIDTGGNIFNSWRHRSCQHVLTWRFILMQARPDKIFCWFLLKFKHFRIKK